MPKHKKETTTTNNDLTHKPPVTANIPAPFSTAPETLKTFLSTLSPNHIYITSLDSHPRDFKRRIFAVPLLLNIFLTCILLYRLQYAIPTYFSLIAAALGYDKEEKLVMKGANGIEVTKAIGRRALMFLSDFILVRFIGMWPWGFFMGMDGEPSPVSWRRILGFRPTEIVIRRSRNWDLPFFMKEDGSEEMSGEMNPMWLQMGKEGSAFQERILPAVHKTFIRNKTSYMMLDKSWELDFGGMLDAHTLVDDARNQIEDFRTAVFVYSKSLGWLTWEVWREHEEGSGEEGTKKLQLIKDTLTAIGKENLFFRLIEVIQSETSQPGPFTSERQKKAIKKIEAEFQDQNAPFDEFWAGVGGIESMPGLEIIG